MISSTILFPDTARHLARSGAVVRGQGLLPHEPGSSSRRSHIRHGGESLSAGPRRIPSTRGCAVDLWPSSAVSVYRAWMFLPRSLDSSTDSTPRVTVAQEQQRINGNRPQCRTTDAPYTRPDRVGHP